MKEVNDFNIFYFSLMTVYSQNILRHSLHLRFIYTYCNTKYLTYKPIIIIIIIIIIITITMLIVAIINYWWQNSITTQSTTMTTVVNTMILNLIDDKSIFTCLNPNLLYGIAVVIAIHNINMLMASRLLPFILIISLLNDSLCV